MGLEPGDVSFTKYSRKILGRFQCGYGSLEIFIGRLFDCISSI
jgi:hypothetical protein